MTHAECAPTDEVFAHTHPVHGQLHWNVTKLFTYATRHLSMPLVPVTPDMGQFCMSEARGFQPARVAELIKHGGLHKPVLLVEFEDGHVLIDGAHRYAYYAYRQWPDISAYIAPFVEVRSCIITDVTPIDIDTLESSILDARRMLGFHDEWTSGEVRHSEP